MFGKAVKSLGIFVLVAASAGFGLTMFMGDASGDFLEILKIGKIGVKISVAAFVPLGLLLLYKSQ